MTVDEAAHRLVACFKAGGKVLVCGNGGSAAEASHFVGELMGFFQDHARPPLPAINLAADPAVVTAIANDTSFARVFERQVEALGKPGDVLIAISTSGQSENVSRAVVAARARDMDVIALTCGTGGELATLTPNVLAAPPGMDTAAGQEWHLKVLHDLARKVETEMFGNPPNPSQDFEKALALRAEMIPSGYREAQGRCQKTLTT